MGVAYPKLSRGVFSNAVINWHIWMSMYLAESVDHSCWVVVYESAFECRNPCVSCGAGPIPLCTTDGHKKALKVCSVFVWPQQGCNPFFCCWDRGTQGTGLDNNEPHNQHKSVATSGMGVTLTFYIDFCYQIDLGLFLNVTSEYVCLCDFSDSLSCIHLGCPVCLYLQIS